MEKLFFFTNDGFNLAATLHLPGEIPEGGAPAVLMCHGLTGNRIEAHCLFVKTSRALAAAGVAALRFDFRGSGESEMSFSDVSILTELSDAHAALNRLRMSAGVDQERLGVLGLSMGGAVTALLVGERPDVKSAALWSAVAHFAERIKENYSLEVKEAVKARGVHDRGGYAFGPVFAADAMKVRPLETIAQSRAPVLVVHGTEDETVPFDEAHAFHAALSARDGCRAELELFEGADHTYTAYDHEQAVIRRTVAWFQETL